MAIAKKPKSNRLENESNNVERVAEAFIAGVKEADATTENKGRKTPIMMRFDPTVLERVDKAAKHRGISRSAWIQFTVSRALDQGEG
jgi:hypothetical protein